jgi:hypothetical protein
MTSNPAHHSRTKHISVPFHYVCEQVELGNIRVGYLPTSKMPADGLTKPLTAIAFDRFVQMLGLCSRCANFLTNHNGGVYRSFQL